jgi:uncharacterized integral membrane protein
MSTPSEETSKRESRPVGERRSTGELVRAGGIVALAVLATLFAVLNLGDVEVDWVFGSGHAPLIIVIVISVLAGILLTYGAERLNRKRRQP